MERQGADALADSRTRGVISTYGTAHPEEIVRLSPSERPAPIEQLWDNLEDCDSALSSAQKTELDNRPASLDEERSHAVGWGELKAELERRSP